jgi:hypothetical protein
MNWWSKVKTILFKYRVDPELVEAYRTAIPETIDIQVKTKGDNYIATVKSVNKEELPKEVFLITEAESQDDLVDMVNDLVFSYKNIPEQYRPYYKQVLKPEGSVSRTENLKLVKAA